MPLLAGGELVVDERRRVERHLIGCESCRGRRDASKQSLAVLRDVAALGTVGAGLQPGGNRPSVWPALARQIRESRHRPDRVSPWERIRAWTPWNNSTRPVVGLALVAAGLAIGLSWVGGSWRSGPSTMDRPTVGGNVVAPVAAAPPSGSPGLDPVPSNFAIFDDFEIPVAPVERRSSALPAGDASRTLVSSKPGSDPFQPPLSLRLDYDLDRGTVSGPVGQDTQRAY